MEPSRFDELTPREAETLRALHLHRTIDRSAVVLNVSRNTVRDTLARARRKVGTSSSEDAAYRFAEFEGRLSGMATKRMVARSVTTFETGVAPDGPEQLVRDAADWSPEPPGVDVDLLGRRIARVLSGGLATAVSIAALIALLIFALTNLPRAISNTTFEPEQNVAAAARRE